LYLRHKCIQLYGTAAPAYPVLTRETPPGISYIAAKQAFETPHILHDFVTKPTFP
jgi:hypothetical protein